MCASVPYRSFTVRWRLRSLPNTRLRSRSRSARDRPSSRPDTTVKIDESKARKLALREGASVDELVAGLQTIGATARDVIAILQAIKAAGALDADLEVI